MRRIVPLTAGSFALGLDAYVVAGLIPIVSTSLHSSIAETGQLVAAFTLSYALLSPICATLLTGKSMRPVLLYALGIFVLGNVLGAIAPSLGVLILSRVIAGFGAGIYAPMSASTAVALTSAERRGRALSMIMGGMSSGTVIGVPAGLALARHGDWRLTLWMIAAIGVVAMIAITFTLPRLPPAAAPTLRQRASVLGDRRVLSIVAITTFCSVTSLGMYTYIGPLFSRTLHTTDLTAYLWIWGLGGLIGTFAIGSLIDRGRSTRLLMSAIFALLGTAILLLPSVGTTIPGTVVLLLLWGATAWSSLTPQQHRLVAIRPNEGPVAVSLNASVLYLGSALGALIGGGLLAAGLAVTDLPYVFGVTALFAMFLNLLITPPTRPARPAAGTGTGTGQPAAVSSAAPPAPED